MQQRIKEIKNLDPEKDLKLEFDEKLILNGYQSIETQEGNTSESMEELDEELQEVGDASMYEYSKEEMIKYWKTLERGIAREPNAL